MGVSEELIDRLSSETGRMLSERARAGRRRALAAISRVVVTLTRDGSDTWEEHFDRPPTLAKLLERAGPNAFVVSVAMRRRTLRERVMMRIAAE
ncbi:MAG: hypothetical protein ACKVPY_01995 [Paracoccaceae bacterium]